MPGYLILEDGTAFEGLWSGGSARAGEVVFNTSHSGYEEIATDPSYFSQIVVMTAPMQGNYGVDKAVWESRQIYIRGFVCLQLRRGDGALWKKRLKDFDVPSLEEVDTRSLTLKLREQGTPWGALVEAGSLESARALAWQKIQEQKTLAPDWVFACTRKSMEKRRGRRSDGPHIAVLDFGAKENILRELEKRSREVSIFPSRASVHEILQVQPDALLLSNGPGDPALVQTAPQTVQALIGRLPIFGICMGHQILALALGGKTYKLKFGHRGSNHPIRDELLGRTYVTSQNHGYAVEAKSLPADARATQLNLNDQTLAGFYSETRNYLGIQYHPESHPGPHDAVALFDFFIEKMVRK